MVADTTNTVNRRRTNTMEATAALAHARRTEQLAQRHAEQGDRILRTNLHTNDVTRISWPTT